MDCNPTHACCCDMVPRPFGTCLAVSIGHGAGPFPVAGWVLNKGLVWDVNGLVLPSCAPKVLGGQYLIREVRPYRKSRFQSCSGRSISVSRGSSGLPSALRIILDVRVLRRCASVAIMRASPESVGNHQTCQV